MVQSRASAIVTQDQPQFGSPIISFTWIKSYESHCLFFIFCQYFIFCLRTSVIQGQGPPHTCHVVDNLIREPTIPSFENKRQIYNGGQYKI